MSVVYVVGSSIRGWKVASLHQLGKLKEEMFSLHYFVSEGCFEKTKLNGNTIYIKLKS